MFFLTTTLFHSLLFLQCVGYFSYGLHKKFSKRIYTIHPLNYPFEKLIVDQYIVPNLLTCDLQLPGSPAKGQKVYMKLMLSRYA